MRRTHIVGGTFAVLLLIGCGASEPEALAPLSGISSDTRPAPAPRDRTGKPRRPVTDAADGDLRGGTSFERGAIELLDPGAEPRVELRFTPTPGDELHYRTVETQHISTEGEVSVSASLPAYEVDTRVTVLDVTDEHFTLEVTAIDGRVEPGSTPQLTNDARAEIDRRLAIGPERTRITRDGHLVHAVVHHFPSSVPSAAPELAPPFPTEPVGVGARWRLEGTTISEGLEVRLTGEVSISAIEGSTVHGSLVITMHPDTGYLTDGSELLDADMRFSGQVTWHLDRGIVLRDLDADLFSHMRINQRGTFTELRLTQNLTMREHLLD